MAFNGKKLFIEAEKYYTAWFTAKANHPGGDWTNRYVEAMKASYYWGGHIDQIIHPYSLLVTIYLVLHLLGKLP